MNNHLSDYKLKGKVKSVSTKTERESSMRTCQSFNKEYVEFNKAGFLIKSINTNVGLGWNRSRSYSYKYNEVNKLIHKTESYYKDRRDGSSHRTKITDYNSDGNPVEEKIITDDDIVLEKTTFKYDDSGIISESAREYLPSEIDESLKLALERVNSKELTLNEFRTKEKEGHRNENFLKEITKYDKWGNKIRIESFDNEGKLIATEELKYNKKKKLPGNLIEKIVLYYKEKILISKTIYKYFLTYYGDLRNNKIIYYKYNKEGKLLDKEIDIRLSRENIIELKNPPVTQNDIHLKEEKKSTDNNSDKDKGIMLIWDYNVKPEVFIRNYVLTEKEILNKDGNIVAKEIYYDNKLAEKTYYTDKGIISLKERFLINEKGVYEYNNNGTIKELNVFNSEGVKTISEKFIHNENNELIEWNKQDLEFGHLLIKKFTYYKNGVIKSFSESSGPDKSSLVTKSTHYYIDGSKKELHEINNYGKPKQIFKYFNNGDLKEHTIYYNTSTSSVINTRISYSYNTFEGKLISREITVDKFDHQGKLIESSKKTTYIRYFDSNKESDNKYKEETQLDDKGNWILKRVTKKIEGKILSPGDIISREIVYY